MNNQESNTNTSEPLSQEMDSFSFEGCDGNGKDTDDFLGSASFIPLSLSSVAAMPNLHRNANKRSFQDLFANYKEKQVQDQHQKNQFFSSGVSAGAPNAITAFLQCQLEASQDKRRKLSFSSRRPEEANPVASLKKFGQSPFAHKMESQSMAQASLAETQASPSGRDTTRAAAVASFASVPAPLKVAQYDYEPLSLHAGLSSTSGSQAVAGQQQSPLPPPHGKPPLQDADSATAAELDIKFYLHRVCRHFASEKGIVEIAMALDPQAIRRKSGPILKKKPSASRDAVASFKTMKFQQTHIIREKYTYPVNIALQNGAALDVLELLVNHGPDVFLHQDGAERETSLSVALRQSPRDVDLIDLIMFANLKGVMVKDRKFNYPLHVACAKGASAVVLQRIYHHYPAALFQLNFNRETPLDIARRSSRTDEDALNFLYEQFHQGCAVKAVNGQGKASLLRQVTSSSRAA